jgi:hypothetical protein
MSQRVLAGYLRHETGLSCLPAQTFVILFTKNLPEGMFKLILIPYRWQLRAAAYALFMVTKYPPFEWD